MSRRILWTLLFLAISVGWLVLSYRPGRLAGKELVFGSGIEPFFIWLFVGCALLFVIIQGVLVAGVRTFSTRVTRTVAARDGEGSDDVVQQSDQDIRIRPLAEYIWTALPLLISLALFWFIWQQLPR